MKTKNWKTTVSGILATLGAAFVNHPKQPVAGIANILLAVGIFLGGMTAQDAVRH